MSWDLSKEGLEHVRAIVESVGLQLELRGHDICADQIWGQLTKESREDKELASDGPKPTHSRHCTAAFVLQLDV